MSPRWERRLEEMRENPKGWRYGEMTAILKRLGFAIASRAGSHVTWKHPTGHRVTIVDQGRGKLKPAAIREALAVIDAVRSHPPCA